MVATDSTVMLAIGIGLLTRPKLSESVVYFFEQLGREDRQPFIGVIGVLGTNLVS
jgi:hypothetical protein